MPPSLEFEEAVGSFYLINSFMAWIQRLIVQGNGSLSFLPCPAHASTALPCTCFNCQGPAEKSPNVGKFSKEVGLNSLSIILSYILYLQFLFLKFVITFQDKDFCIITVPHMVPEFHLIQNFVRIIPFCNCTLDQELYVFHRSGLLKLVIHFAFTTIFR